jgi:hypothetical protein
MTVLSSSSAYRVRPCSPACASALTNTKNTTRVNATDRMDLNISCPRRRIDAFTIVSGGQYVVVPRSTPACPAVFAARNLEHKPPSSRRIHLLRTVYTTVLHNKIIFPAIQISNPHIWSCERKRCSSMARLLESGARRMLDLIFMIL